MGGPCSNIFVHFLLTPLVSVGSHVPRYYFFHFICSYGARHPEVQNPAGSRHLIVNRGIEFHPTFPSREERDQAGLFFLGICPTKLFTIHFPVIIPAFSVNVTHGTQVHGPHLYP